MFLILWLLVNQALANSFSGGATHGCWVSTGVAYCAGSNSFGQLALPGVPSTLVPMEIPDLFSVDHVLTGSLFTCFQQGSEVWCAGYNGDGQMGLGSSTPTAQTSLVLYSEDVSSMAAGGFVNCVVLTNSTLACSGTNANGQLGLGHTTKQTQKVGVAQDVDRACNGAQHLCYLTHSGEVLCGGSNSVGQIGSGTSATNKLSFETAIASDVLSLSCGGFHNCAIMATGGLLCWGSGYEGQMGRGDLDAQTTPVYPFGFETQTVVESVSLGYSHSTVIFSNGTTMAWGYNTYAQLGLGHQDDPVSVPSLNFVAHEAVEISAALYSTCVKRTDETFVCVGRNQNGMLGFGSTDTDTGSQFVVPFVPITESPTLSPERVPTISPSASPTSRPSASPNSGVPTLSPITNRPTSSPVTSTPSMSPTYSPTFGFGIRGPSSIVTQPGVLYPVPLELQGDFTSVVLNISLTNSSLDGYLGLRGVVDHYLSSCSSPNAVNCKSIGFVATKEQANELLYMLHFEYTRLVNGTQGIHIFARNDLDEETEKDIAVYTKPAQDLSFIALIGLIATGSACGVLLLVLGFASVLY